MLSCCRYLATVQPMSLCSKVVIRSRQQIAIQGRPSIGPFIVIARQRFSSFINLFSYGLPTCVKPAPIHSFGAIGLKRNTPARRMEEITASPAFLVKRHISKSVNVKHHALGRSVINAILHHIIQRYEFNRR